MYAIRSYYELQAQIDAWYRQRRHAPAEDVDKNVDQNVDNTADEIAFLREIGYLQPEGGPFSA